MEKKEFDKRVVPNHKAAYVVIALVLIITIILLPELRLFFSMLVKSIFYLLPKVLLFTNSEAAETAHNLTEGVEDDLRKGEIIHGWILSNSRPFDDPSYVRGVHFVNFYPYRHVCSPYIRPSLRCLIETDENQKDFDCIRKIFPYQILNSWMYETRCGGCEEANSLFAFMTGSIGLPTRVVFHRGADHVTAEFYANESWIPVDVWWYHNSSDNTNRYVGFDKKAYDRKGSFRFSMEAVYLNGTTEDITADYALEYGFLNIRCKSKKRIQITSPTKRAILTEKCSNTDNIYLPLNSGESGLNYTVTINSRENVTVTILSNISKELVIT
ncbi:transglutaminase domain-containing protein [Candidatus Woesearchaeota archaeon]|nr:transglutaminase domain-containing protein [Candidatus Woesearchaeota archaeon]